MEVTIKDKLLSGTVIPYNSESNCPCVNFGFSRPKGLLLLGSCYFRVAVTFGWLKNVYNSAAVLHKEKDGNEKMEILVLVVVNLYLSRVAHSALGWYP